jgi:hypothetical protein
MILLEFRCILQNANATLRQTFHAALIVNICASKCKKTVDNNVPSTSIV